MASVLGARPGFVPLAGSARGAGAQGRAVRCQRTCRVCPALRCGPPDDLVAVRLAESPPRSGESATGGSGQQRGTRSRETCAPRRGRRRSARHRAEPPGRATGLARRAAPARGEPQRRCPSLAPPLPRDRVWEPLWQMPSDSAPGGARGERRQRRTLRHGLRSCCTPCPAEDIHAAPTAGLYLDAWTAGKAPSGGPGVAARALPRSTAQGLCAIDAQEFLPGSGGGRPGGRAHQALATRQEVRAGCKGGGGLEAELQHCFGS